VTTNTRDLLLDTGPSSLEPCRTDVKAIGLPNGCVRRPEVGGYPVAMSEQPPDVPADDEPLADVPPVAGGTDDSPPAQGEGEDDSW
jgi:hypothetical protein